MPNSSIVTAKGAGLVKGGVASPEATNMQDYNGFDRSSSFYQTQRFAEISPIFSKKFISGDKIRIRSTHDLRSYTLKSPLMSNVYMHRSFFSVPLQAIYHNTFKPFFVNPVKGNDISSAVLPKWQLQFFRGNSVRSLYSYLYNAITTEVASGSSDDKSVHYLNCLFLLMQIYSKDGLLQKLGYSMSGFDIDVLYNFIEGIGSDWQSTMSIGYSHNNVSYFLSVDGRTLTFNSQTYNLTGEKFRSIIYDLVNNKFEITSFYWDFNDSGADAQMKSEFYNILNAIPSYSSDDYINPEKLFAYQMVCAQFFTNSYVDDIHDAFSWLVNNLSLLESITRSSANSSLKNRSMGFTLNGVRYNFDLISSYIFETLTYAFYPNAQVGAADTKLLTLIFRNIFEVQYSLRTSDYFVDSRTQPLAVGNVYSAVVNNQVSAIDINISLWQQRFLNAVNRLPYHIENYLKGIFGFEPQSKEPKPYFISKERFLIGGQEVENTADTEQGKVVTNLRTVESRYVFETFTSEPCIIIGMNSYSMDYAYGTSMDKEFIEFDRFDNFNPFLQHAGDQILYARELDNNPLRFSLSNSIFAYQLRYMQYKKSIPAHASGGFLDNLPSWIALYEKTGSYGNNAFLNSDFIRNSNVDFDGFYSSLTGFNPCEYFHFIARFDTICHVNSKQQKYPSLV